MGDRRHFARDGRFLVGSVARWFGKVCRSSSSPTCGDWSRGGGRSFVGGKAVVWDSISPDYLGQVLFGTCERGQNCFPRRLILKAPLADPELWFTYDADGVIQAAGIFGLIITYVDNLFNFSTPDMIKFLAVGAGCVALLGFGMRSYAMENAMGAKLPCPKEWPVEAEFGQATKRIWPTTSSNRPKELSANNFVWLIPTSCMSSNTWQSRHWKQQKLHSQHKQLQ